ncbi:MAG: sugar phosphate nucleotidyltransferase [Planctomycetaceae bacterium]
MSGVATLILAGGRGDRLRPLTIRRAKPAIPFAGRALIDFTLENCLRSGVRRPIVLTQYLAGTVARHLERRWARSPLAPSALSSADLGCTFRGTADAARAALPVIGRARTLLVLAGDHVYGMDYRSLLRAHLASGAHATLSAVAVPCETARGLGVLAMGEAGRVEAFAEKPAHPPALSGRPGRCLASMGIYAFDARALAGWLGDHPDAIDFGRDLLPGMLAEGRRVDAREFPGYWRDIADLDAYHAAHMDRTQGRSFLGAGVTLEPGATVSECVLCDDVRVEGGARLHRVVAAEGTHFAADFESDASWGERSPGGVLAAGWSVVPSRRDAPAPLPAPLS